ncbi:17211_t:CDS:2, partial [Funneliformis geosporum]
MNFLIDFLEFPPREIIDSKAQQHVSVPVEDHSSMLDNSDHTSSSIDATPSNFLWKRSKLDRLIDSTGDGSGSSGSKVRRCGQFLMMKELVHFFCDSALLSRTHSQPGSTNIFTG